MSRKQSYDLDLSMSARLNYPQKLSSQTFGYKKYQSNFDKFSSQVIQKNTSQQTNYTSNSLDFSGIRKLPQNISSIRETFSFNPAPTSTYETGLNQNSNKDKTSRLNELLGQAIELKNLKRKQQPKSQQGILSASVNLGQETYSKSQTQISQKSFSALDDKRFDRYMNDTIAKNSKYSKSYSVSVEQEISKLRLENRKRKQQNSKPLQYQQNSPYLKHYPSFGEQKNKDSFSKKNYIEYYSPKIEKSTNSKNLNEFNTLSPPYQRRKKQTSFQAQCDSPKVTEVKTPRRHTMQNKKSPFSNSVKSQTQKAKITDFVIGKKLGQGRFGVAHLAFHKATSGVFAIKIVKKQTIKTNKLIEQFILEVKLQTFLTHPFILKIYGIFDDQENIYLVMEYLQQGSLFNYLKNSKNRKLTQQDTALKVRYLAESIKYLQDRGIAHRDIKPENIIMTNGVCKLADFGWATFCDEQRRKTYCGTCDYVAPQIIQGHQYDETVDLWCIGVLTFELLTGRTPFYHMSQKQTRNKIVNVNVVYPEDFSEQSKSFISGLIQKDPGQRMTIEKVLAHPFLRDIKLGQ